MTACPACGHQLGVGRFCTNCGAPVESTPVESTVASTPVAVDWRTDTAERKLGRPVAPADPRTPPAAVAPPPPPRYPLFADELDSWAPSGAIDTPAPGPVEEQVEEYVDQAPYLGPPEPDHDVPADDYDYDYVDEEDDGRRTALPWILAALAVLAIVVAGWWFLARDDGTDPAGGSSGDSSAGSSPSSEPDGIEVAGRAAAKAPTTAPPNEDVNGQQVSYDASNMLDGVAETAWRAPGDASGTELVFKLREPTELTRLGLINGYAKTSTDGKGREFDWYLGNRRITAVLWILGDGHKQRQELTDTRKMQSVDIDPVTTSRVVLRLVTVSAPGDGTAARDFTAVSEVSLTGVPS